MERVNYSNLIKLLFVSIFMIVFTACGEDSVNESSKEVSINEMGALIETPITEDDLAITEEVLASQSEDVLKVAEWIPELETSTEVSKIEVQEKPSSLLTLNVLSEKLMSSGESTDGWIVYDNSPSGATISSVSDSEKGDVLKLSGAGLYNGYVLGYTFSEGSTWNDKTNKTIKWSMKYNENFIIYVRVTTTDGYRYLYYTNSNRDYGEVNYDRPHYIHNGLGVTANDGTWRTFTRDLSADLKRHQPDNEIISVDGFFVRGSGYIDDVELLSLDTEEVNTVIYEDAEDGQNSRWDIYTRRSPGTVSNVYDESKSSRVIDLQGDTTNTGYILGSWNSENGWKNTTNKEITWDINYDEFFIVYLSVETELGHRFMVYTPLSERLFALDPNYGAGVKVYGDYTYIHSGLNPNTLSGSWQTVRRDIEADIQKFEPNNSLKYVNAFLIRGSGRLDNIKMFDSDLVETPSENIAPVATAQAVTVAEDTIDNVITLAGSDADGDTLTYAIVAQPEHGTVTLDGNVAKYTPLLRSR